MVLACESFNIVMTVNSTYIARYPLFLNKFELKHDLMNSGIINHPLT